MARKKEGMKGVEGSPSKSHREMEREEHAGMSEHFRKEGKGMHAGLPQHEVMKDWSDYDRGSPESYDSTMKGIDRLQDSAESFIHRPQHGIQK